MELKLLVTLCLLFGTASSAGLALYAAYAFRTPGAKSYIGLLCSIAIYCFGYALELNNSSFEGIYFSLRIEYLGIPFLPVFWMILAMQYAGYGESLPKWFYKILFILPVVTVFMVNTNSWHHLHYASFGVNTFGPFPLAQFSKGIWYHINIFYTDVCFFVGNLLFLRMMLRSVGRTRKQAATMFLASIAPWVADFIYQSGLTPYNIDIVPFIFAFVGPVLGLGLFRFKMFDFVPIARHRVFDFMKDPVLVLDMSNRLADFNRAASRVFDALTPKAIGSDAYAFLEAYPALLRSIDTENAGPEKIRINHTGNMHVFELSLVPIVPTNAKKKEPVGKMLMLHDITRQQQLMEQLQEQASKDGLTGVFNHRYFMEMSETLLKQMNRHGQAVCLIIMDLDYFKRINDSFGHLAGDEVLRRTAALFQGLLRESDIFGRYGGEEFVFFLPQTAPAEGKAIAERLRAALAAQKVQANGRKISITGSFGVFGSDGADQTLSLELLCQKADEALYRAKARGRNRVELVQSESVLID